MSKRIGELLIERGVLDPGGLDRALKAQLIFGGHLGTNLIELGLVDESSLGNALAEMLRIPYVPQTQMEDIPQEAIDSIDRGQVEKHHVVPLLLRENELHVAVIHPKNLGTLSQRTGLKIVPHVAPEIRIFQAMETYYGIPRRSRYLTLCHELDGVAARQPVAVGARAAKADAVAVASEHAIGSVGEHATFADESLTDLATLGEEFGYGRDWREIIDENHDRDLPETPPPSAARGREAPARDEKSPGSNDALARLLDRLSRADDKCDLSSAVLDHVVCGASGAVLFGIRSSAAFVWDYRGIDLNPELIRRLRIPVTAGSIFTLLLGRTHYRGRVPEDAACRRFYTTLQIAHPQEILILPIYLEDRLVAILYAEQREGERLASATDEYRVLGKKLSLAMNMLILKHKIRAR